MSLIVTFNGANYIIPTTNEVGWGSNLDAYFVAIAAGALQKTGGSFTLSADVNFGPTFGLVSQYFQSADTSSTPGTTGRLRLTKTDAIVWRNNASTANLPLAIDGSDRLTFNGNVLETSGGLIELEDGNASAPSLTFASDTSKGLYGTSNALNFSTNGTFAVQIDGSQNVGIGINPPTAKLDVEGSSITGRFRSTTGPLTLDLATGSVGGTSDVKITLENGSGSLWCIGEDEDDANKLKISTSSAPGSSDKFTFTTDGRLGVGNTAPDGRINTYFDGATSRPGVIVGFKDTGFSRPPMLLGQNYDAGALDVGVDVAFYGKTNDGVTDNQLGILSFSCEDGATGTTKTKYELFLRANDSSLPVIQTQGQAITGYAYTMFGPTGAAFAGFYPYGAYTPSCTVDVASDTGDVDSGVRIESRRYPGRFNFFIDSSGNFRLREVDAPTKSIILSKTSGNIEFPGIVAVDATINQLVLGTTNTTTISATAPSASRIYTFPDVGTNANVLLDQGTQTITGSWTFTNPIIARLTSPSANPALANIIRLASGDAINWRNNANTLDISLSKNTSDVLLWSGNAIVTSVIGTTNQITATPSGNSVTLSTPQNINTSATPTFASETLTAVTNQLILGTTNTTTISSMAPSASRTYTIPDAGTTANFVLDQGNYTIGGTWTFSNPVTEILKSPTANPALSNVVRLASVDAINWRNNANTLDLSLSKNTSDVLLWSGNAVVTSITGTTNEITATPSGNGVTLSTPQAINTSATPTFASETLTAATNQLILGTTTISSTAPSASRTYTIPDAGIAANFVLDQGNYTIGGTWSFSNPITAILKSTSANPAAANVIRLASSDAINWRNNANSADLSLSKNTSDVLLWSGNAFVTSITGTTNQITATPSGNGVALSTPQNIDSTATPTFASETLTATTNQLVLGTTHTTTISSTAPSASRTYTLPDAGTAANFVLDQGNYTIAGAWQFSQSVGFGGANSLATNKGIDIWSGGLAITLGADNSASTRTDATTKSARIASAHYTNAATPVGMLFASNTSTTNILDIGGGTGQVNAVTEQRFYTATTNTTTGGTQAFTIDANSNVAVGTAALATSATNGFLYIPTCAGAPSGVPTSKTGLVPVVYDTTDNKLYIYNGAWKSATFA